MGFLLRACKQCGEKRFALLFDDGICSACQEKNLRAEEERKKKEAEARLKEIEDQKVAAAQMYQKLADCYETMSNAKPLHLDAFRQHEAICKMFIQDFQTALEMPFFADVLKQHMHESYLENSVRIDGFGIIKYTRIDDGNVKLDFKHLLKGAELRIDHCQRVYRNSEEFRRTLKAMKEVSVNVDDNAPSKVKSPRGLLKTSNVTAKTPTANISNFIAVDVETTGLSPSDDDIVEIAAVRFVASQPTEYFHSYIKPHDGLKERAQKINGITEEQVKDAPYFEQIDAAFCDFIGEKTSIIGHNLSFDYGFITALGGDTLVTGKRKFYDTLDLARRVFDFPSNKLDDLCASVLDIVRNDSHSALSDALATGLLFNEICNRRIENIAL